MPHDFDLAAALADYRRRHPGETPVVDLFEALLADPGPVYERRRLAGHFTGSAWLVDASGQRVLLTHHRKLGRWLQLGGHADGDANLAAVALKEGEEESGLGDLVVERAPQEQFFERLGSARKELHLLPGFFHDTLGERDRGHVLPRIKRFVEHCFDAPLAAPSLLDADKVGASCAEAESLAAPLPRRASQGSPAAHDGDFGSQP